MLTRRPWAVLITKELTVVGVGIGEFTGHRVSR